MKNRGKEVRKERNRARPNQAREEDLINQNNRSYKKTIATEHKAGGGTSCWLVESKSDVGLHPYKLRTGHQSSASGQGGIT